MRSIICACIALAALSVFAVAADPATKPKHPQRNVIIFVADGMRHGSVNAQDSPTMLELRRRGVHFTNSHALFPTFTTANASAIATGHYLGDTGDFSNTIYIGYPIYMGRDDGRRAGTVTPFLENDAVLNDVDDHYDGNFLHETSLIAMARQHGYSTAVLGKIGPVGVQDISQLATASRAPQTIFFDDATGSQTGIPLSQDVVAALDQANLPTKTPDRSNGCELKSPCDNGYSGDNMHPGTTSANTGQQKYFADALTRAILPMFVKADKPFAVLYWSRDPDGTQHYQGDSLNQLAPGINGPTSRAGIRNADDNLKQILDFVEANPRLEANTDISLTSDHGYATISRQTVDAAGTPTKSYAATFDYKNSAGELEIDHGFLPNGFVAIDLAHALGLPLYDPDTPMQTVDGPIGYALVDPAHVSDKVHQRPIAGNGVLGGSGRLIEKTDAEVIVAANGGSDLIYVPNNSTKRVRQIVAFLGTQDYVGAIFVDDKYGAVPGSLPLSSVGLNGGAVVPHPAVAISFRTFYLQKDDLMSAIQIADTSLHQGQGMHGSFGRDNTLNNMAAIGPDFKSEYEDPLPVSNADIAPTLAYLLGFQNAPKGKLTGRVIREALKGEMATERAVNLLRTSKYSKAKSRTVLHAQRLGATVYYDEACLLKAGATQQLKECR